MRSQYSEQYNFTIQHELARDLVLQIGYVGSQGHRLLASNDLNRATPQTCLDIAAIAASDPSGSSVSQTGDRTGGLKIGLNEPSACGASMRP